jgi:hypothetical protein
MGEESSALNHLEKEALAARASYLAAVDPAGSEAPIRGCVCYSLVFPSEINFEALKGLHLYS